VSAVRSIARNGSSEIEIQRSRFHCTLARVTTAAQAAEVIAAIRKDSWDATHHCTAFRVGPYAQEQRSNDDGEPAGTAGVPMLDVLTRRELTDTLAVVTRYYGGIKLGAGGLIRAYGRAVAETIDHVGTVRRVAHTRLVVTAGHADAGRLDNELRGAGHRIADVRYGAHVELTVLVPMTDLTDFTAWLADRTGGRVSVEAATEQEMIDVPD
jgi:uncharacterized YigZ family protein